MGYRKTWQRQHEARYWCWCAEPETSNCQVVNHPIYGFGRSCEHEYFEKKPKRTHKERMSELDEQRAVHESFRAKLIGNGMDQTLGQIINRIRAKYPEAYSDATVGQGDVFKGAVEAPSNEGEYWNRD